MAVAARRTDFGDRLGAAVGGEAHAAVAIQRVLRGSLGRRRASEVRAERALHAAQGRCAPPVLQVDSDSLERLLFKPSSGPSKEGPGAEFLAGLIDSRLLIDAWKEMLRKQRVLERSVKDTAARLDELDSCNIKERLQFQARSLESFTEQTRSLERQVEARAVAQNLVTQRLGEQVEASRAAAEEAVAVAERQDARLASVAERVDVQERAAAAARERSRAEEEAALARHQEATEFGRLAVEEVKGLEAKLSRQLGAISSRLESTDDLTAQAVEETRSAAAYVRSQDFEKVVDGWSSDCFRRLLPEVSTRIHAELLRPMQNGIHQKFAETEKQMQDTKESVNNVSEQLSLTTASLNERLTRLRDQGATLASLGELREQVFVRAGCCEAEIRQFTEGISTKVLDVTKWVSKLQLVFHAHEHALQHMSEEMHNRCSKFDMAMVDDTLRRCAMKDVVDEKLRSLRLLQEVQGTAIERIDVAFGKQADDMEQASDPDEQAVEPARPRSAASSRSSRPPGSPRSSSPRLRARGRAGAGLDTATDHCYQLRHQMESLAQGVLGLASLTTRSTNLGLPREARAECESQLVHHLACVLHWVTHRAAPAGWAPSQLTSLRLRAFRGEDAGPVAEADGGGAACRRRSGSPGRDAPASPRAAAGRAGGAQELPVLLAPLTPLVVDSAGKCSVAEAANVGPGAARVRPPSHSSAGPGSAQPRGAAAAVRPATAEPAARAKRREEPSLEVSAATPRPETAGEAPMPAFPAPSIRRAPRAAQPKPGGAQKDARLPSAVARPCAPAPEPSPPFEDLLAGKRQSGVSSRPDSRAGGRRAYVVTPDVASFSAEVAAPAPRR